MHHSSIWAAGKVWLFLFGIVLVFGSPYGAGAVTAQSAPAWFAANQGLAPHAPVTTIVLDPLEAGVVYAGVNTPDSLYVSADGGVTWQRAGAGVAGQPVFALLFDPQDPDVIWAGTADGLYRGARQQYTSGWTWARRAAWPPAAAVYSLAEAPDGRVYAAGADARVWMLAASGWAPLAPLPGEPSAVLSVAAPAGGVLLAGTDGDGLFVSRDAGQSWESARAIGATFVAALWAAPWDADLLLARTRAGLFRSDDAAVTWQRTAEGLEPRVDAITGAAADRSIYLGLSTGDLLRSNDGGVTWNPWGAGVGRDGMFYTLSASPAPGALYAGTHYGVYRSEDGGLTWQAGAGLGAHRATALMQADDGTLYLGNEDGVYVSTDAGDTWQVRSRGLPLRTILSLAISPHDPQVLYAATEGDGIYRSSDGGRTWGPYAWEGYIIAQVVPDPDRPGRIYARVAYERIYVSDDDGATWTPRWDSMDPTTEIQSFAISPHAADVIYAGAAAELYRSPDRAADWQRIGAELEGQSVFYVGVDRLQPDTVYAGATKGLYRSEDGGDTWARWGRGLEDVTVTALALDPQNRARAFAGTKFHGVYATSDGGAVWQPWGPEPSGQTVFALVMAEDGRRLFAATDRGFQRLDLPAREMAGRAVPPQLLHSETGVPVGLPVDPSARLPAPRYGVHTLAADERTLPLAQVVGADSVVQLFTWRDIEPTKGQFVWQAADEAVAGAEYYGLNLIVRLDHPPEWATATSIAPGAPPVDLVAYSQWVRRVVERYKGRVGAYIIWNEPNLALEWAGQQPDPKAYVELLNVGYTAVKAVDPQAVVVSAGLAPTNTQNDEALDDRLFLEEMYRHGAGAYFDVLGVHAYGFGRPPDDPRGAHGGLNLARTEELREIMVRHGDGTKPLWITEMGWTIKGNEHSAWQEVTLAEQAAYLVDALALIRTDWPWVDLVTIWNLGGEANPDWGGYSLLEEDGVPRPAYTALQAYLVGRGHGMLRPASMAAVTASLPAGAQAIQVLAPDAVIHLGDNRLPAPWMPLHRDRNPSPAWRGIVYVRDPGAEPWQLSLRVMQSNFWSNRVWVNGQVLPAALPVSDFSKSWVSYTVDVPPGLLRRGPNEIRVTIAHAPPLIQDKGFGYDKLQFKDIVLRQ
jgi:photosystem II stability/assembly factor-like uncharacterized protein/GH35 family endo-1,4-beta-xylanase